MAEIKRSEAQKFRDEVTKKIHDFMIIFDPSGSSAKKWDDHFASFKTDDAFVKEIKRILDNPKIYFSPEIQSFNKNAQPKFNNLEKLAKMVEVELEEYVALPYLNENTGVSAPAITLTKVPVGKIHLKRLQQILRKKNKVTTSADKRDSRTGQVVRLRRKIECAAIIAFHSVEYCSWATTIFETQKHIIETTQIRSSR